MRWIIEKLFKIEPGISLGQWGYERFKANWQAITALFAGGGAMTYLATITDWLNEWGPIAWGIACIVGILSVSICFLIYSKIMILNSRRKIYDVSIKKPSDINTFDSHFHNRTIDLQKFYFPVPKSYFEKTFEKCDIMGPATIYCTGHSVFTFSNLATCDFVKIKDDPSINNVVHFHDVTIRNFFLYRVTILMNSKEGVEEANWITD